MATEPRKIPVSLRTNRVAVREQANEILKLNDQGQHDEALARAADLVNENKGLAVVHKLLGILHRKKAARLGSDVLANSFRERACAAFSDAARLAPKCLLTAFEHAEVLAECAKYEDARAELIRGRDIAFPIDPGQSYVGYEKEKFSIRDTSYSDRLAMAREKADSALKRIEKQVQHRNMLSRAEEFWQDYPNKDSFKTVSVQKLSEYLVQLMHDQSSSSSLSKSVADACSFVKEHNKWGFFVWDDKEFMDISLLFQYLRTIDEDACSKLEQIVGAKLSEPAAQNARSLSGMKFIEDDKQGDILHLPTVECVLAEMQFYPYSELPFEMEIKGKKHKEALKIFEGIVKDIKGFTADMENSKVQTEKIQSSWLKFLEACYFDYREVLLPLATMFQWDKLKQYMTSAIQICKEPSSFLSCSKCWKSGHGIKDCNLCIVCDSSLHTIANCPVTKEEKSLAHLVGSGTPGLEFFVANEPASHHVTAHISVEAGTLTADLLVQEFFHQFDWEWDWSARQLGQNSFVMKFPSLGKVEELSKSTLLLENSGATIRVSKQSYEPVPKAKLHRVWVIVNGVPETSRHYKILCAIGSMVGAVKEIDIEALEEFNIVRIMVDVKDPQNIPHSKEYGVPPDLYDLYFCLESVVTAGGAYAEGNNGTGENNNSQDSRSYWPHTGPRNDASHQSTGPSGSADISRCDTHAQSAGQKIVTGTYHGTITPEPIGRLPSRLDFPGTSKGPVANDADEARQMQIQADCEIAMRLHKRLEGRPRRSQDAAFSADDIHESWEAADEVAMEEINNLIEMDGKLPWLLQHQLYQHDDNKPEVLQKKNSLHTSGKGGFSQKPRVKLSVLNSYGDLQTPLWLKRGKKLFPQSLPTQEFHGEQISEEDARRFALYCRAATDCPTKYTICHVCSFEGVFDRRVIKDNMEEHFNKYHDQLGVSYECEVCQTRARTSLDIRKHHHFAHMLPADWWPSYIPDLALP